VYYFEVGRPIAGCASYLTDAGRLTHHKENISALKTFSTLEEAQRFYDTMGGRWGGEPLILRTHQCDVSQKR
jgi:hypothetical protein